MNTGFTSRSGVPVPSTERPSDEDYPSERAHPATADVARQQQEQYHPYQQDQRPASQSVRSNQASSSYQQHAGAYFSSPMYPASHQVKAQGQQHQLQQHHHQQSLQHQQHQPPTGQVQLQRESGHGFNVPRSISTPAWISNANAAAYPTSSHISNNAPSSSSSSGSLLSYWDQSVTSDSDPTMMASAMPTHAVHPSFAEMGHHRHASSAAPLPSLSASGVVAYGTPSNMSSSASSHSYNTPATPDHYHPYQRPSTMQSSMGSSMPSQHMYHSSHPASSSGALAYPSSMPAPLASPGFVYGPSGSSATMGAAGSSYDAYPQAFSSSNHSQYVSYLPPALSHDSRFYPLNPFEIKHRRRTTKTQFRVLESTFREIPKPNAALRKQISAQLDMPIRAVQIWFQNRRAKAKAMEKKRQTGDDKGEEGSSSQERERSSSGVASHSMYGEQPGERRGPVGEMPLYAAGGHEEQSRGGHAGHFEEAGKGLNRSMDLPPLRMPSDMVRQDTYTQASPTVTLPSINVDSGPSRDRRGFITSPTTGGGSTLGMGYVSGHGAGQEPHDEHAGMRGGQAYTLAGSAPGLGQLHSPGVDATAASPAGSTLSAGMPVGHDRSGRMSGLPLYPSRETMTAHSTSPRPPGHEQARYWSAAEQ